MNGAITPCPPAIQSISQSSVASPEWRIEEVPADGEFSLVESGRSIKVRHVPTIHNEDMLVIYLPEARLLFESDIYVAPGGFPLHQPLPAPFGDWAQGLRDGLAALDWEIAEFTYDRCLHLTDLLFFLVKTLPRAAIRTGALRSPVQRFRFKAGEAVGILSEWRPRGLVSSFMHNVSS